MGLDIQGLDFLCEYVCVHMCVCVCVCVCACACVHDTIHSDKMHQQACTSHTVPLTLHRLTHVRIRAVREIKIVLTQEDKLRTRGSTIVTYGVVR